MNFAKILMMLSSSFALFACSLADVDDESDFTPAYGRLVGCWVSTESGCREICFNADTSFTVVTNTSDGNSSVEMYGYISETSVVSKWGEVNDNWRVYVWAAISHTVPLDGSGLITPILNGDVMTMELNPYLEPWSRGTFFYFNRHDEPARSFVRAQGASNCGTFGSYLDTTSFTLESLRSRNNRW